MNKVASVKLSLRKLFIATLAIGPLAILPSPLWAVPASSQYQVTNGSVSLVAGPTVSTFTVSDRTVIVWSGNDASSNNTFYIPATESWSFAGLSSTGAVLNKVGYAANGSTNGLATAVIAGSLNSPGHIFILANGNIVVNSGATIDSAGLVLSTLNESSDFNFTTTGNLALTGASSGNVTLGNTTAYTLGGNFGNGTGTFTTPVSTANTTAVNINTGGLSAFAGSLIVNNLTVAGDVVLNQSSSAANLAFDVATGVTGTGNLTIVTNNGAVGSVTSLWKIPNGTTSVTTGNAAVTLTNVANDFSTFAANTGSSGTSGTVAVVDANNIVLGASTVGQDLIVTAAPASFTGNGTAIGSSGTLAVKGNLIATTTAASGNSAISIGNNSTVGGTLNLTTNNSSATFSGLGNINMGTSSATTAASLTANRNAISITTNGVLTVGNVITAWGNATSGGAITLTGGSIVQTALVQAGGNATSPTADASGAVWGPVTLNATAGNITTGPIYANQTVTLNASAGSINVGGQTATAITTLNTTGTSVVKTSASGSADLSSATNSFAQNATASSVLQFTGGNITVTNSGGNLTIGSTNATGNYTLTDGANVVLGTGAGTSGQNITVGGVLTVTANGAASTITDSAYTSFNVFGNLNLTTGSGAATGGVITLNAARTNGGLSPLVQFGSVNANTNQNAAVTIAETSTLNLGTINSTTLTATSVSGNVIQSGAIKTITSTAVNVGSTGTIVLGNTSNSFAALTMNGGTDASATAASTTALSAGSTPSGNTTLTTTSGIAATIAGAFANLTVNSGGTIAQAAAASGNTVTLNSTGALTTGGGAGIGLSATNLNLVSAGTITVGSFSGDAISATNLTINSTNSGATSISQTAATTISATGNTTVISSGNVALDKNNDFATVTINTAGNTLINDINNLTIGGVSAGQLTTTAGISTAPIASTWNLTLANLTVNALIATAGNGGAGNSGSITQAAGSVLHSETLGSFTTATGNIIVANAGNSVGRVQLSTGGGNATITYAEDSTVKLGNINNGNGTVTITSRTGSIIEDTTANDRYTNNATLSLQAPNGSITIGGTTNSPALTGFTTDGNLTAITANAPSGSVALFSNTTNLTLSTINANSLTVNSTGSGNLTQTGAANIYGIANITASGNVTLGNTTNNFGPILLNETVANKNLSITESGTMNLRTVTMFGGGNGTFTANSVNGDIITTGFGGVRPGGNNTSNGTGVVSLTALKGNITVGDATADFPTTGGVVFNSPNNVSITVLGGSILTLGSNTTASTAGNLTVTSAIGNIASNNPLTVSGNASFTAGNANISLASSNNQFGTLKFSGNQVNISQANDMKILTGSTAIGASSLASLGGNISIVNVGGVASFGSTLSLFASGNITLPKLIQVGNTLTVNAGGTKDLSSLSISGDLSGKSPLNIGSGAYLAPQP